MPSLTTRLHLESDGNELRLWNPATQQRLPTPREALAEAQAENRRLRKQLGLDS